MKSKLLLVLLLLSGIVGANPIDTTKAKIFVKNFYWEISQKKQTLSYSNIVPRLNYIQYSDVGALYYIFNINKQDGFVIIAADDRSLPIIGYSINGTFESNSEKGLPPALIEWMKNVEQNLEKTITAEDIQSDMIKNVWENYLVASEFNRQTIIDVELPVITTWNQNKYYNQFCPATGGLHPTYNVPGGWDFDNHVPTGCTATAMAQIMKYWSFPATGLSAPSYTDPPNDANPAANPPILADPSYGQITGFGPTTYNWLSMPPAPSSYNDGIAVATLMSHCGISVTMDYSYCNSTSPTSVARNALVNTFLYSNQAHVVWQSNYTPSEWENLIIDEIDNYRPMFYSNTGTEGAHAFVCYGYQTNTQGNAFYFNWGWGGQYNILLYPLNYLGPNGQFTDNQEAIINIYPDGTDLLIADQLLSTYSTQAGSSITAYSAEQNRGPVSAGANVISVHLSSDNILTPGANGDLWLGDISVTSVAGFSLCLVNSVSIQIPSSTIPGNYYVFFSADGGGVIPEFNEFNNFATQQITITSAVAPPSNDNCTNAISLTSGTTCNYTSGTIAGATQSIPAISCGGATSSLVQDVWYSFVAVSTFHTIQVVPSSGLDIVIDLRSGTCNGANIACSNNGEGLGGTENLYATGLTVNQTYYIRIYPFTTTAAPPASSTFIICITHGNLNCYVAIPLTCGTAYISNTTGNVSNVTTYNCTSWNESGPEKVHTIQVTESGTLSAQLSGMTADLDVFILGNCNNNNCLAYGDNTASFTSASPGTYYIVVDGYNGAVSAYTLTVTCNNSNLNCTGAIALTCGVAYNGNTSGSNSNVNSYNCSTWNESGPEKVHTIQVTESGKLSAQLSGMTADLDVFILGNCNNNNCLAYGDNTASFTSASPGTYYIVVDGYNGAVSAYTLTVTCSVAQPPTTPCPGLPTVTYSGQTYNTVQIGSQCWFKENLNVGTRINNSQSQSNNGIIEKYCYNNLESNCNIYGGLYQWNELMQYVITEGVQGICPSGWHIPTDGEWTTLATTLGGSSIAGGKMKETGLSHWLSPNTGATNESGFTALPNGIYLSNGPYFAWLTQYSFIWSSTQYDATKAMNRNLEYNHAGLFFGQEWKTDGNSVRCLKDQVVPSTQTIQNITIASGQTNCYNATQTINVAGNGTTFTVQNRGSATMIAGQNILFLPGTTVQSGGYLHGYIAPSGPYCGGQGPSIPSVTATEDEIPMSIEQSSFEIYPNPTTGNFILELKEGFPVEKVIVDVYGMRGEKVLTEALNGERKHEFSLSNRPVGVYFVRVITGHKSETVKIIKQ